MFFAVKKGIMGRINNPIKRVERRKSQLLIDRENFRPPRVSLR